jgi:hypothetical protein
MDKGTIRSLSVSLAKKKVVVAEQVAITATMTRRERCHAKKENRREQLGFQEKEGTKTLSSPKKIQSRVFHSPRPQFRHVDRAIHPQENLATFGYRSQRKAN